MNQQAREKHGKHSKIWLEYSYLCCTAFTSSHMIYSFTVFEPVDSNKIHKMLPSRNLQYSIKWTGRQVSWNVRTQPFYISKAKGLQTFLLSSQKLLLRTLKLFPSEVLQQLRAFSFSFLFRLPEKHDRSMLWAGSSSEVSNHIRNHRVLDTLMSWK